MTETVHTPIEQIARDGADKIMDSVKCFDFSKHHEAKDIILEALRQAEDVGRSVGYKKRAVEDGPALLENSYNNGFSDGEARGLERAVHQACGQQPADDPSASSMS